MQLLIYPVTDSAEDTRSRQLFAEGFILTKADMDKFERRLPAARRPTHPTSASRCSQCPDLHGLPPAYVATAGFDPLRDEGEAYALRMRDCGVRVALRRHSGLIHTFVNQTAVNRAALGRRARGLRGGPAGPRGGLAGRDVRSVGSARFGAGGSWRPGKGREASREGCPDGPGGCRPRAAGECGKCGGSSPRAPRVRHGECRTEACRRRRGTRRVPERSGICAVP